MSIDWKSVRAWFYAVMVSAGPIATFYGFLSDNEVALWLGLGGTILGLPTGSTALKNFTPSKGEPSFNLSEPEESIEPTAPPGLPRHGK